MKSRFSSLDLAVIIQELQRYLGMRVVNVYDIDNKTYLIRIGKPDEKTVIVMESGTRVHSTDFDWPKNPAPSGFSMKLRKHLKGRRLEMVCQLGFDRIVDFQFGSGEAAYHIVLELYDRGNMVLTDHEYTILTLLRARTDVSDEVRFAVREKYPITKCQQYSSPTRERIVDVLQSGQEGDSVKKLVLPHLDLGPALLEHALLTAGFSPSVQLGKGFHLGQDLDQLMSALQQADVLLDQLRSQPCKGYIVQRKDKRPSGSSGESEDVFLFEEFHPYQFKQHATKPCVVFEMFNQAVDQFFSKLEGQRVELKAMQQEKTALKKLDFVRSDQEKRIENLQKEQATDILKGQLIEMNLDLVDEAILIVRSALANQVDWKEISNFVKEAQTNGNKVALAIHSLKLETNQITLALREPFVELAQHKVDIDLSLSAYGNSRKYFERKKQAAKKEQKTLEATSKALKSAEKKAKETLKDVAVAATICKTRKTFWFEKFLWFVSSENYLVIGGRDQQQNELIVKRYMKPSDVYVHADLHGASSCVIVNPTASPVPPKTLNEAGTMAICNSAAWDSKVITSAWWVHPYQVSKTAPSGEYLSTGSFMIRGKKNYLPPSYLIYGFGFLFKLEDGSIARHQGERKARLDILESGQEESGQQESGQQESGQEESGQQESGQQESGQEESGQQESGQQEDEVKSEFYPDTNIQLYHLDKTGSEKTEEVYFLGDNVPVVLGEKVSSRVKLSGKQKILPKKGESVQSAEKNCERKTQQPKRGQRSKLKKMKERYGDQDDEERRLKMAILASAGKEDVKQHQTVQSTKDVKLGQKVKPGNLSKTINVPDVTSADVPDVTSADVLDVTSADVLNVTSADVPDVTSADVPDVTSADVPDVTSADVPDVTSADVPDVTSADVPDVTSADVPDVTSADVLDVTSADVLDVTSADVLDVTSADVPDVTSADVLDVTSADVLDVTDDDDDDVEEAELNKRQDSALLDALTGVPVEEDELLFAVPVWAPYNAITNYKFKVKLQPGSTKKGKAMKTALNMFLLDKMASSREKSLLKIFKDSDLSRNLPGKVKLAAPNLKPKHGSNK
ncbi:ribosome quality control complex subunit NEMF-like [Physella acuta]|uniref:ribosome quality control complex subunit NEMF-like n=1 Tax=Physella acuta TaxID=109671 RepID=UPI0027DB41EE|nr:ribosome quality control complex subunit NEMF-like [Physella acuta]XP_059148219.1 ribosome quality control complex subunit NEMF-like [Physella acuta]XP_059148220.1 ribosome quality control complex subunit NEMF-like [Physella acuta]XP_059148221.1 ribosome quality control complex subunit NEMF-like [Physella acuta]XP_059148223.1 ribosome quality control complex subunit NEMF-like [Physella acuta]